MKDFSRETFESGRPSIDVLDGIDFCLERLYAGQQKCTSGEVAKYMSYEELLGVLLLARDEIQIWAGRVR